MVLSPFEVSAASEEGTYAATSTLAGTRLNMQLKDVPASISVMSADFLRDIGATNLSAAIEYGIGTEQDQSAVNGNNRQTGDLQLMMRGFVNSIVRHNRERNQCKFHGKHDHGRNCLPRDPPGIAGDQQVE